MLRQEKMRKSFKRKIHISLLVAMVAVVSIFAFAVAKTVGAEGIVEEVAIRQVDSKVICWAFISAAVVVGLSAIAAGIAVAYVGSAALGAISEKPELVGRSLIFVGLAEGIAIYGLIIAIMILAKVG